LRSGSPFGYAVFTGRPDSSCNRMTKMRRSKLLARLTDHSRGVSREDEVGDIDNASCRRLLDVERCLEAKSGNSFLHLTIIAKLRLVISGTLGSTSSSIVPKHTSYLRHNQETAREFGSAIYFYAAFATCKDTVYFCRYFSSSVSEFVAHFAHASTHSPRASRGATMRPTPAPLKCIAGSGSQTSDTLDVSQSHYRLILNQSRGAARPPLCATPLCTKMTNTLINPAIGAYGSPLSLRD
jgi:hypothetical protein